MLTPTSFLASLQVFLITGVWMTLWRTDSCIAPRHARCRQFRRFTCGCSRRPSWCSSRRPSGRRSGFSSGSGLWRPPRHRAGMSRRPSCTYFRSPYGRSRRPPRRISGTSPCSASCRPAGILDALPADVSTSLIPKIWIFFVQRFLFDDPPTLGPRCLDVRHADAFDVHHANALDVHRA